MHTAHGFRSSGQKKWGIGEDRGTGRGGGYARGGRRIEEEKREEEKEGRGDRSEKEE